MSPVEFSRQVQYPIFVLRTSPPWTARHLLGRHKCPEPPFACVLLLESVNNFLVVEAFANTPSCSPARQHLSAYQRDGKQVLCAAQVLGVSAPNFEDMSAVFSLGSL